MNKDDSIHCLGNGHICAYAQGPNFTQVFGPPYSVPMMGRLEVVQPEAGIFTTRRDPGTAIWRNSHPDTNLVDFTTPGAACLVRQVTTRSVVILRFTCESPSSLYQLGGRFGGETTAVMIERPAGEPMYMNYPFPTAVNYLLLVRGACQIKRSAKEEIEISCIAGISYIYLVGGPSLPEIVQSIESVLARSPEALLEETRQEWLAFSASRFAWDELLAPELPQRARLLQTIDDVAVLIRSQQSREGGILAGHNYHLAYVRDQYGMARGLLALGHIHAARQILEYYWKIWQRHGRIHNGQAAGVDGVFHVHENDEVEITGYLVLQAFDDLEITGDDEFIAEIFPMLAWAWEAQARHLVDGMLPFNGDETYVAGGVLPRWTLNDGSAEATFLFFSGGKKLLAWLENKHFWTAGQLASAQQAQQHVLETYRANFWRDGQILTNNPRRASASLQAQPRFRHGVCESCLAGKRWKAHLDWLERSANGRYLCADCQGLEASAALAPLPAVEPLEFKLQSVSLIPFYLKSDFFTPGELAPLVGEIARQFSASGRLPSRPGDPDGITVGYDYGFLLYALSVLRHPLADLVYTRMLDLLDSRGAWVEYYADGKPLGTRCRPWESAINLEAAIRYAQMIRMSINTP